MALLEQQGQLDRQIGQVEQRILDVQQRPFHSETPTPLMALLIDGKNNGIEGDQEDEVPRLKEYIVPRLTNNLPQSKVSEAGVVVSRFLINSTIGLAGFFDVAETQFGLTAPAE